MPTECIYKYVILRRIVYNLSELQTQNSILNISPIYEIMKNAKKYNLLEFIKNAVNNGEYISKHQWRIKVKTAIFALSSPLGIKSLYLPSERHWSHVRNCVIT